LTLWNYFGVFWMNALLYRAKARLEDEDPWSLSPKFTHRELYDAVSAIKGSSIMAQYLRANALDLSIDVSLNVLSALLSFGNPLLLKVIWSFCPKHSETRAARRAASFTCSSSVSSCLMSARVGSTIYRCGTAQALGRLPSDETDHSRRGDVTNAQEEPIWSPLS
jgi:hypothetical protein